LCYEEARPSIFGLCYNISGLMCGMVGVYGGIFAISVIFKIKIVVVCN
jgi:hypothetical protein